MSDLLCTREGCEVATIGKCLEGFEPRTSCPYLSDSASGSVESEPAGPAAFVDLPSGEALDEIEAAQITRGGPTSVVLIAGPSGSGKTTILTCLFEAFLEAPFGNFLFAGSRTLVGFERRCHDARITSGRSMPHTPHTKVKDVVDFLHLQLARTSPNQFPRQNLLLSDVSGERFRALRDSSAAVGEMKVLRRADHLCIVIDGERLSDPGQRQAARTDARMLLRSLIEADALSSTCRVEIVVSKWDLVLACSDLETVKSFVAETRTTLERQAEGLREVRYLEIAARPENESLPFAFGLPTLLRTWLEVPTAPARTLLYLPRMSGDSREASRFANSVAETERLGEFYDVRRV